jgi:hypothetical protein
MEQEEKPDRDNIDGIKDYVRVMINREWKSSESIPEEKIKDFVTKCSALIPGSTQEEKKIAAREIMAETNHTLMPGTLLSVQHEKWFLDAKKGDMQYSERTLKYLTNCGKDSLPANVVRVLDNVTDEIMDCLGDPKTNGFKRYGLVMGEVQSGKTNTYAMMTCKAADTGYRVIILLTGTTELLRQQTQKRMDRLFVGENSGRQNGIFDGNKYIGSGSIKADVGKGIITLTSSVKDFRKDFTAAINMPLSKVENIVFMAVKKNKSILKNLHSWLRSELPANKKTFSMPMLFIDDEADNASINTASDPAENTAINKGIKSILSLFDSYTYVGFTATPYANIFINPDVENDIYPHDFIYCLNSPSNYISPVSMFEENGSNSFMLRDIPVGDKGLPEIPYKHTKELVINKLPETLIDAVNCFLLSCAVRDIWGQTSDHMSMLINVSRFTNVQERVKELVDEYLYEVKNSVKAYAALGSEEALGDGHIRKIKESWDRDYQKTIPSLDDRAATWEQVLKMLPSSINPICVRSVNQKNGPQNLDYDGSKNGLRVIAVGGNSLSRGLTLKGLCVSYFYRRAESYDTLMQMGRWFGYRDTYRELCRVWMTAESCEWYAYIAEATEELRGEFNRMRELGSTPDHFGFRVRNDLGGLLVTARNKMRYTGDRMITKCVSGEMIWTSYIDTDNDRVDFNDVLVGDFLNDIEKASPSFFNQFTKNRVWTKIPAEEVVQFLNRYKHPALDYSFDVDAVTRIINETPELSSWDVAVQQGSSSRTFRFCGEMESKAVLRSSFSKKTEEGDSKKNCIRLTSSSLVTPDNMKEGLCIDEIREGKGTEFKIEVDRLESINPPEPKDGKINYPAKTYLRTKDRRPLMLIYPIDLGEIEDPKNKVDPQKIEGKNEIRRGLNREQFPIGIALGFPAYRDENDESSTKMMIKYKTNAIYERMRGNEDLDEEDE